MDEDYRAQRFLESHSLAQWPSTMLTEKIYFVSIPILYMQWCE
jgi:hypothetical protein